MAEPKDVGVSRLEAISDGVVAIIITIMVLELRPPSDPHPLGLVALWPDLLCYGVSFATLATYWVNHRYLFNYVRAVNEPILWSNFLLLLMLSLLPFATAYMGRSRIAPFPTAVYATAMLASGLAFWLLSTRVEATLPKEDRSAPFQPNIRRLNVATMVTYALSIPTAYISPPLSLTMSLAVAIFYMTPLARPR
jgi:uncharacterized membrane protein